MVGYAIILITEWKTFDMCQQTFAALKLQLPFKLNFVCGHFHNIGRQSGSYAAATLVP